MHFVTLLIRSVIMLGMLLDEHLHYDMSDGLRCVTGIFSMAWVRAAHDGGTTTLPSYSQGTSNRSFPAKSLRAHSLENSNTLIANYHKKHTTITNSGNIHCDSDMTLIIIIICDSSITMEPNIHNTVHTLGMLVMYVWFTTKCIQQKTQRWQ